MFEERDPHPDWRDCRHYLAQKDRMVRYELCTDLAFNRMDRKVEDLRRLFESCAQNWDQTAYLMLMRTVGDTANRANYEEIARRVPFNIICREGPAIPVIEALLFGTAGLLAGCRDDAYSAELKSTFDHLKHKHSIRPLDPRSWKILRIRPGNHPRLRLAQVAVLLSRIPYMTSEFLECSSDEKVIELFGVEASQYWSSYYNPSSSKEHSTKRLGTDKARMLGINLIAVFQILYGNVHGREEHRTRAINLWESLPAEENRYTRFWSRGGVAPFNALESQALLQLSTEYCSRRNCDGCPLESLRRYDIAHLSK